MQHLDDAPHVARVKPDAGLVEHEQVLTKEVPSAVVRLMRCTSPPLKRARLPVQGQIAEPDLDQIAQPDLISSSKQLRRFVQRRG